MCGSLAGRRERCLRGGGGDNVQDDAKKKGAFFVCFWLRGESDPQQKTRKVYVMLS